MSDPGLLKVTATASIYDSPHDDDAPAARIEGIGPDVIAIANGDTEIVILRAECLVLDLHRIENVMRPSTPGLRNSRRTARCSTSG